MEVAEGDAEGGTGGGRDGVVEDDDKVANKERRRPRPAPPFQAEKTRCAARHVIVSTTPHVLHVLSLGTEQVCIWSPLFSCIPQASCTLYSGRWALMASRKLTLFYEGECFANTQHGKRRPRTNSLSPNADTRLEAPHNSALLRQKLTTGSLQRQGDISECAFR